MKLRILVAAMSLGLSATQAIAETKVATVQQPAAAGQPTVSTKSVALTSQADKVSYAIGMDLGENFKTQAITVNPEIFLQGFKDVLAGNKPLLTKEQRDATLQAFQKEFRAKKEAELKAISEKNKQASQNFLAVNKAKPGVVVLPSGLQYKIIKAGSGAQVTDTDVVTVNYVGRLPDGKEFDSSIKRGKPVTFMIANVIPGWREALKLMSPGASWEVVVPSELAYGDNGIPGTPIGPNQALIFQIDLVSVKKADDVNKSEVKTEAKLDKVTEKTGK